MPNLLLAHQEYKFLETAVFCLQGMKLFTIRIYKSVCTYEE